MNILLAVLAIGLAVLDMTVFAILRLSDEILHWQDIIYVGGDMQGSAGSTANASAATNSAAPLSTASNGLLPVITFLENSTPAQADQAFDELGGVSGGDNDVLANLLTGTLAGARIVQAALDRHLDALRDGTDVLRSAAGLGQFNLNIGSGMPGQIATAMTADDDPGPTPFGAGIGRLGAGHRRLAEPKSRY